MNFYITLILLDILFFYNACYLFQMLQQSGYNENKRFKMFIPKEFHKHFYIYLLEFIFVLWLVLTVKFTMLHLGIALIALIILLYFWYLIFWKHNQKLPLKFTKRMVRIVSLDTLIFLLFQIIFMKLKLSKFIAMNILLMLLNSHILLFVVFLLKPIEKGIYNHYKKIALDKLNRMNNLKIIGVTGSFGKTSTKMVLNSILSTELKGFYTPASFNTPNGILMTINNENTIFNEYFISEMGAKSKGEIKELADLVKPKYGIITCIGKAHLDSFKSIENICHTKFELIESLDKDGVAVLNKDDEYQRKYDIQSKCKKIWIGINRAADVVAKNVKITSEGTSFDIFFKKENKTLSVQTILLGNKNIYNILEGAALAHEIGISDKGIIKGIKNIEPINHRLEIKNINNVTIIDDAFNSNPEGSKNALNVLNLMPGMKIIITPGMVEMGQEQESLNFEFGKQIADVCDKVYLVGKKQTEPIYNGLIEKKYDKEKIIVCSSFKDAYNDFMNSNGNKKCSLLIENDLPDSYTEG